MSLNEAVFGNRRHEIDQSRNPVNVGGVERLVSAMAGGALAVYGMRQRSMGGLCLALTGTALLHRGVTGHCDAYELIGFNTNQAATGEAPVARDVHVEKAIVIDKTPEELFAFWRQFENLPYFLKHI